MVLLPARELSAPTGASQVVRICPLEAGAHCAPLQRWGGSMDSSTTESGIMRADEDIGPYGDGAGNGWCIKLPPGGGQVVGLEADLAAGLPRANG